jgi:hypothetical protein
VILFYYRAERGYGDLFFGDQYLAFGESGQRIMMLNWSGLKMRLKKGLGS